MGKQHLINWLLSMDWRKWPQSTYRHSIHFTNVDRLCPNIFDYIHWLDSLPIFTLLQHPYRYISQRLLIQLCCKYLYPLCLLLLCDRYCALADCLLGTWNHDWNLLYLWCFWPWSQRFQSYEQYSVLMLHFFTSSHFLRKLQLSRED